MAKWATPEDVIDSWIGADVPTDAGKVSIWVDRAERYLTSRIPSLTSRITAGETDLQDKTIDVVAAMVQRVFRNPSGTRQRTETTGPFSESVTYGGDQPGALFLTDSELNLLSVSGTSGKAFMVDMLQGYTYPYPGWTDRTEFDWAGT